MPYFLYIFVILFAVCGLVALITPRKGKELRSLVDALPLWGWGIISLIAAALLWSSAPFVLAPAFVKFLAVLATLKGIGAFILSRKKQKIDGVLEWWSGLSDVSVRLFGAFLLLVAFYLYKIIY